MIYTSPPSKILKPSGGFYLNLPPYDLVHNTLTLVNFNTTLMGFTDGIEDGENYWLKPEIAGLYHLVGLVTFYDIVAAKLYTVTLKMNGIGKDILFYGYSGSALFGGKEYLSIPIDKYLWLSKTDYVQAFATSYAGVDTVKLFAENECTYLQCIRQR